jgi:hypothetical protein
MTESRQQSAPPVQPAQLARALTALRHRQAVALQQQPVPASADVTQKLREALSNPLNVTDKLIAGDRAWMKTVVVLEDNFFARDERLACGRALGDLIKKGCFYDINMAVERTGTAMGKIRMAEGALRQTADDADAAPICEAYADCVAMGRVGKEIPLPPGVETIVGMTQKLESTALDPQMKDPVYVRKLVEDMRLSTAKESRYVPRNTFEELAIEDNRRALAYIEVYLKELEGATTH